MLSSPEVIINMHHFSSHLPILDSPHLLLIFQEVWPMLLRSLFLSFRALPFAAQVVLWLLYCLLVILTKHENTKIKNSISADFWTWLSQTLLNSGSLCNQDLLFRLVVQVLYSHVILQHKELKVTRQQSQPPVRKNLNYIPWREYYLPRKQGFLSSRDHDCRKRKQNFHKWVKSVIMCDTA